MKLLIIEGPDRCGKNTLIQRFLEQSENSIVRHWGSAKGLTNDNKRIHQYQSFKKEFELASRRADYDMGDLERYPRDIYIWNRAHLGEFVYGTMYRQTRPEEWVMRLEEMYGFDLDIEIHLVLLTASPKFLCKKDDGKSFSAEVPVREIEIHKFKEAFELSKIQKKLIVNVEENGKYRSADDIFDEVNKFVFGE